MTTADLLGAACLAVALVAFAISVFAIRRDRACLIIREADGTAGSLYLRVVNVGLRPVRIVYVVTRAHRWRTWVRMTDLTEWCRIVGEGGLTLPLVLDPAAEVVVKFTNPANFGVVSGGFAVIDAAGTIHWPALRTSRLVSVSPPGPFPG